MRLPHPCRVRPGQRCVTLDTRYPIGSRGHELMLGSPTTAHKARYQLWCWLWCRTACNNQPSISHHQHQEGPA